MSGQYWIKSGHSVAGPFSREQVAEMAGAGGIRPGDLISTDQVTWRLAKRAPEPVKGASAGGERRGRRMMILIGAGGAAAVLIAAVVRVLLPGGPAGPSGSGRGAGGGGAEAPAQLTAFDRAVKFAPFETVGLVHVEVAPVAAEVFGWLRKHRDVFPGADVDAAEKAWSKVAAIDVFLVRPRQGAPPAPVVVLHGRLRMSDIQEIARLHSQADFPVKPAANGRYESLSPDLPARFVCGAEADDLADDCVLAGPPALVTDALLGGLGAGDRERLGGMLAGVDVSAPIWGAAEPPEDLDPQSPRLIAGSADPRSGGTAAVKFDFRKPEDAGDFEQFLRRKDSVLGPVLSAFRIETDGASIALKADAPADLVGQSLASLARARALARRAKSAAQLKAIGAGIAMYVVRHRGSLPKDLAELVLAGSVPLETLVSPAGDTPLTGWDPKAGRVPGDYVYMHLPPAAPPDLLTAYERPELNGEEGTNVLLADGDVKWVKPEEFQALLRRTRDWLAANAKGP